MNWPDLMLKPINLFNMPSNIRLLEEAIIIARRRGRVITLLEEEGKELRKKRIASLENLYYLRTGKLI